MFWSSKHCLIGLKEGEPKNLKMVDGVASPQLRSILVRKEGAFDPMAKKRSNKKKIDKSFPNIDRFKNKTAKKRNFLTSLTL